METVDVVIIGAGIAGASLAAELSDKLNVVVVEKEDHPGYHATGRSAALYSETYGNPCIRALTSASRDFFSSPPEGFSDIPLWRERGVLFVGREDQKSKLKAHMADTSDQAQGMREMGIAETVKMVPIIDPETIVGAIFEPEAMDLDVDAIHSGFLRRMKRRGGKLVTRTEVLNLSRENDLWTVKTSTGTWASKIIVNAAGAWADHVAEIAGIEPLGLKPLRRTAVTFPVGSGESVDDWPMVVDVDEEFYFKPEGGKLLGSPADETETVPCDAQAEELDVAIAIDRIQRATVLDVKKVDRKWAGLRTFSRDKSLVIGFDAKGPGFFWLAGQGGYGIQTSPAAARVAARLIAGDDLPADVRSKGVTKEALSPTRFTLKT